MAMRAGWATGFMLALGCAGSPAPVAEPVASSAPEPPKAAASSAPVEPAPTASEAPAEPAPAESPGPREVKYVMVGGKLEIHAEGVRMKPVAKAVKHGAGWGIALEVTAESEDEKMHSFLAPKARALALAGKLTRKSGGVETLSDAREGDDEALLSPGTPLVLERKWPNKASDKPLASGDKLELQVGLWGLGPEAKARRPLKKLLLVSMTVGKGEPRPLIAPPE